MTNRSRALPLLATIALTISVSADTWTAKQSFPFVRTGAVAFSIGHKGYLGTGMGSNNFLQQDFWEYDPLTNAWTQKANFGGGLRQNAVAFVVGSKAFVGTGTDGTNTKADLWQYDPTTNAWTQRVNIGGVARQQAVAFSVGAFGYLGTGKNQGGTSLNDFWRYDPSLNQWVERTTFAGGLRTQAVGFAINGAGYVGTGIGSGGTAKNDLWAFNPTANTWTQRTNFAGTARSGATAMVLGNLAYVGTGLIITGTADLWAFDPSDNAWFQKTDFTGSARFGSASFSIAGKGYFGTGTQTNFLPPNTLKSDFYEYDPATPTPPDNSWTDKAIFGGTKRHDAVGFGIGNKGYLGTGYDGTVLYKDFWEFDTGSNAWTQKADFGGTARHAAVGFSILGKGYIGTGADQSLLRKDFWEYDPAANTWTQKTDFGGIARDEAVGFSIGAKGYIGTGFPGLGTDFWEYDPIANAWTQKADFGGGGTFGATGFSIGGKGYIGTGENGGQHGKEFWEYDPVANAWAQKADYGGPGVYRAAGFGIGSKGYIGTGEDDQLVFNNNFWEYDPIANAWTQKSNLLAQFQSVGFSIGGKGYIGVGTRKDNFLQQIVNTVIFEEYNPGQVTCSANQVSLTLNTDKFGSETSWEIRPQGQVNPVCNGNGYASNTSITITCCLLNGCYDLRVFDSFGDGMTTGGFVLRDGSNQRITDNSLGGGGFTTLSQVTNSDGTPWSFCVPIGSDALVPASCDQIFSLADNVVIQTQTNAAVTAQLGLGDNSDDGYQICIFDPNGGFRRNTFQSLASPGTAFPTGTAAAAKPTYFNLNFSQAPFLPTGRQLNVRIRSKVNGVFAPCGPACRIQLNAPTCTTSQLTTTADPAISCGATGVNVNTGLLYCTLVPGANKYQLQFTATGYSRNIATPSTTVNSVAIRTLQMASMTSNKPPCGVPVSVQVHASFDGGTTYCPFGPTCTVTFTGCTPAQQPRELLAVGAAQAFSIWPNPSSTGQLSVRLDQLATDVDKATIEVMDAYGKRVKQQTVGVNNGSLNTLLDLGPDAADGLYIVTIHAGDRSFTQRVMMAR